METLLEYEDTRNGVCQCGFLPRELDPRGVCVCVWASSVLNSITTKWLPPASSSNWDEIVYTKCVRSHSTGIHLE
jgi:hypothetical protein